MKKSTVLHWLLSYLFEEVASIMFASNTETINLPQGKIKGSYDWFKTQKMFLGIPYASVTERFQDPGNPPSWNDTLTANRGNIMCNQYFSALKTPVGQEDCLVLNVFTPPTLEQEPFPVMVFIHGGGFSWGSNSELIYNPTFLVQEKVIVVTINYRLGAFGFLCLGLKEAPGNVGLKDQLAALKWIQNNIFYFGGDPDSVTIFGESAGAVSIHHLLLTDSANGLFHRAILQSGSFLMPHDFSYQPIASASKVALRLGYNTSDPTELLNIFRNSTDYDIVKASEFDQSNNPFASYLFTPCMEKAITSRKPLITDQPTRLLNKQLNLNVSVIVGFNDREGIYWAAHYTTRTLDKLKASFHDLIPSYLFFEKDTDKTTFMDNVIKIYFRNRTDTDALIEYFTDSLVAYPVLASSEILRNSVREIYNYYFKYDSIRNLNKFMTWLPTTPGACHGDELFYIFQPAIFSVLPPTSNDAAMIRTMTLLWTSFAKTGKPSNSIISWRSSEEELKFLEINKEIQMATLPNEDRMEFWRKTFETYRRS